MAASIETGHRQRESARSPVSMLKENLDKVLPIMADILRRPLFAQEKIDLAKIEARTGISRRNDDIAPDRQPRIQQADLWRPEPLCPPGRIRHHRRHQPRGHRRLLQKLFPSRQHVAGRLGRFRRQADGPQDRSRPRRLAGRPALKLPALPEVDYEFKSHGQLHREDRRQPVQHHGRPYRRPAGQPRLCRPFGHEPHPFLRPHVQDASAPTRGWPIRSGATTGPAYKVPGVFSAGAQTKSESTVKAISIMLDEMKRIRSEEVSDEELKRAKDQFLNSYAFPVRQQGPGDHPHADLRLLWLSPRFLPADLQENRNGHQGRHPAGGAENTCKPEQVQILVVGQAGGFRQAALRAWAR